MPQKSIALVILAIVFGGFITSFAAEQHGSSGRHAMHDPNGNPPKEAGQAAFAAIAEIVRILETDIDTNWSEVNIDVLRTHLVDMNELTLNTIVERRIEEKDIIFNVTGKGAPLRAIKTMVPAHAGELDKMADWSASAQRHSDGARLILRPANDKERMKILGLGFFGLMATGSHHQSHHFGMAIGRMQH